MVFSLVVEEDYKPIKLKNRFSFEVSTIKTSFFGLKWWHSRTMRRWGRRNSLRWWGALGSSKGKQPEATLDPSLLWAEAFGSHRSQPGAYRSTDTKCAL